MYTLQELMGRSDDYKDFTIKARCHDFTRIEYILYRLNAHFIGSDQQVDTYFETEQGKLKLRSGNIENVLIHYERFMENGIERTRVYQYTPSPEQALIAKLYRDSKTYEVFEKTRQIYFLENVKIHLDKTKDGNSFVEIEAIDQHNTFSMEELRAQCLQIKELLGINDEDIVTGGYVQKS